MNYKSIKLEKEMYGRPGKSFTDVLEQLDPSENYRGTPLEGLDAFQRQLKRFNIHVSGKSSDTVQKFFKTSDSAALFPEYLSRAIHQGMEEANVLNQIVATVTQIEGMDYRSIASIPSDDEKEMKEVAEGDSIPTTTVHLQENLVELKKRGRMLEASYEAIQFQKLDLFTVTLKQIGTYLATTLLGDAVNVLMTKDNDPEGVLSVATDSTITYDDMIKLWGSFGNYEMNTILVAPDVMLKILAIPEFQNPLTGMNFQGTGRLTTPLGATLIRSSVVPAGKMIGLDNRFAIEQVVANPLMVESDKLIDRQLERTTISTITGFAKIFEDASKILNVTASA